MRILEERYDTKSAVWAVIFFFCIVPQYASDISFFAGFTDVNSLTTVGEKIELNNFNVFGIRYEQDFWIILGLENTLAFSPGSVITVTSEDDNGLSYAANLVLNLPVAGALPYVTWGLGFLRKFGDSPLDIGTKFTTNWGTGVKLRRRFGPAGLRFDYRRLTIRSVRDESVRANELSAGIILTF